MNINQIADIIGANVIGTKQVDVLWLLTDSRSLSFPENTLFFALNSGHRDGAAYINILYQRGVRAFVVGPLFTITDAQPYPEAVFLIVGNTLNALQQLAAFNRSRFDIPVVGITGSNGKTIVKEWLYQLLRHDYAITRSPRSYNSQIGVPLSVWQINQQTTLGIIEAGISQPDEMQRLEPIVKPTIGVITNLGDAHQDNFTSLEQKCREKLTLFRHAQVLIYPQDNGVIAKCVAEMNLPATLSWGQSGNADVRFVQKTIDSIIYQYKGAQYSFPFPYAFVEDAFVCLLVMLYLGYSPKQISQMFADIEPIAMRLEVKQGHNNTLIINDSYNSDLTSLRIALDMLDQRAEAQQLTKTIIISDIPQQAIDDNTLYQQVFTLCKARKIDNIITIGTHISKYADSTMHVYMSTDDFLSSAQIRQFKDTAILLKGARSFRFERISALLEQRLHETKLEVNLSALVANLNHFRSLLRPTTKIVSMVKANAYGVGAIAVAKTLQHYRADYLAVAVADEGVELRNNGIFLPIIVMDPEAVAMDAIISYHLEPNIYNLTTLYDFMLAVERAGLTDYPIHIKIDSGMHRLGFEWDDMNQLITILKTGKSDDGMFSFPSDLVKVKSVFSHLAGADDPKFDEFTLQQIHAFSRCADKLIGSFDYKILKHILNSAGMERFAQYQFDMARLGISHYGFSALPNVKLQNVCTLKTIVLQVKTVKAGESIGYSRKTFLTRDSRIAVIPIGYADGFDRHLSNGVGEVLINGKRCKIAGNICMDQAMVDVTDVPNVKQGDEVIVFGDELPIEEMAEKLGTITYEVLTSISPRVSRVYYQE